MSNARDRRRCALQALYQFDASTQDPFGDEAAMQIVRDSLADSSGDDATHDAGFELARAAWSMREQADALVADLTPDWPTYRQPVIDRNILRLACYEIISGVTPPKVAINEAVELAKEFSTEKSPLFINGVLDKIYKSTREQLAPDIEIDLGPPDDDASEDDTARVVTEPPTVDDEPTGEPVS